MNIQEDLSNCIPSVLSGDIGQLAQLPWTTDHETNYNRKQHQFEFQWYGERLKMPYRVYYNALKPETLEALTEGQRLIIAALLSRHANGHVREKNLALIIQNPLPWLIPFIVQLSGEYILEIVEIIKENLEQLPKKEFAEFFKNNPGWFPITQQRMISYWNCYDRVKPEYTQFANHPAHEILTFYKRCLAETELSQQ